VLRVGVPVGLATSGPGVVFDDRKESPAKRGARRMGARNAPPSSTELFDEGAQVACVTRDTHRLVRSSEKSVEAMPIAETYS